MAAHYRKIDPRMWKDEKFRLLAPREKLIAVYIVTGQSNRCGIFAFSIAQAAEETLQDHADPKARNVPDAFLKSMINVCSKLGWKFDDRCRVIYIPTWWKYNPPNNPKHLQACLDDLHDVPATPLMTEFKANSKYLPTHCVSDFDKYFSIRIKKPKRAPGISGTEAGAVTEAKAGEEIPPYPQGGSGGELPKRKRGRPPLPPAVMPPELCVPEFVEAWGLWKQHLREKRVSSGPTADNQQFRRCVEMGIPRAIAAINFSIAQRYQGLVEPRTNQNGNGHKQSQPREEFKQAERTLPTA